ncbi:uncharacterized protein LOC113305877 [Papaver somniferum]|uniref:uncharacterized protein LOC113305877 n=1 Tax=Papaver somniferum TaxID=3469 RepID=UPI000E6F5D0F|nr:uncharacterized protein LOC113305877 [Papaver somniferum]
MAPPKTMLPGMMLPRMMIPYFSGWARHMLGQSHVRAMLDHAQVTRAIQAAVELRVYHDVRGIVALLACWCVPTHTFICIWGEFTITLEDVVALMNLPVTGNFPATLSTNEKAISEILTAKMHGINKSSSKTCYAQWLKEWWTRDRTPEIPVDGMLSIAAFLCMWLSRDVFEDSGNLLKPFVIPFAIKMARGEKIPVGSLFLGSLFSNLDSLVVYSSISNGFMKIETYANTMFLQALLWERFEKYAPIPRSILQGPNADIRYVLSERDNARIMRWSTKKPRKNIRLTSVLDEESEFNLRPWVSVPSFISQLITFNNNEANVILEYGVNLSDVRRSFILSCTHVYLVSVMHGEYLVEENNIDRAARQMGLDQCVPDVRKEIPSVDQLKASLDCTHLNEREYMYPCPTRAVYPTPGYVDFWRLQLDRLFDFIMAPQTPAKDLLLMR